MGELVNHGKKRHLPQGGREEEEGGKRNRETNVRLEQHVAGNGSERRERRDLGGGVDGEALEISTRSLTSFGSWRHRCGVTSPSSASHALQSSTQGPPRAWAGVWLCVLVRVHTERGGAPRVTCRDAKRME